MASPEQDSSPGRGPSPNSQPTNTKRQEEAAALGDLAQAYRDLARGEQTATALEASLTSLESKLDGMLAALDADCPPGGAIPTESEDRQPDETDKTKKAD